MTTKEAIHALQNILLTATDEQRIALDIAIKALLRDAPCTLSGMEPDMPYRVMNGNGIYLTGDIIYIDSTDNCLVNRGWTDPVEWLKFADEVKVEPAKDYCIAIYPDGTREPFKFSYINQW